MRRLLRWVLSRSVHLRWVLADQVLVSGCNFAIAIVYARALGPAGFGIYALLTVAQQYFVSVSVSLIGNPLTTAAPHVRDPVQRQLLVQNSFAAQLLTSAAFGVVAAAAMAAWLLSGTTHFSWLAVLGLAASSFALPLVEWCRRWCFLEREGASLFRFDALVYFPLIISAWGLLQAKLFTLDMAILLWGMSSTVSLLHAMASLRLPWRLSGAGAFTRVHWRTSRDFIVSFQAQWLGSQGIAYLAAPVVGASGIGAYRSIAGLLGFTNALGTTLDNVLPLRLAAAYQDGGDAALWRYTARFGIALASILVVLLVPLGIFAESIVGFVLGPAYFAYAHIFWVQCINIGIVFASRIVIYHERAKLHTRRIAVSAILGACASLVFVFWAAKALGPVGVAWSTVLGGGLSLLYLAFSIWRDMRKS